MTDNDDQKYVPLVVVASFPVVVKWEATHPPEAVFSPATKELAEHIKGVPGFELLGHLIPFSDVGENAPIKTQADFDERNQMLLARNRIHYVRLSTGAQFIVFGDAALRFLPGETWSGPNGSRKNGKPKRNKRSRCSQQTHRAPASATQRKKAAILICKIAMDPFENLEEAAIEFGNEFSTIQTYPRRYMRPMTLNYETATRLIAGAVLNPKIALRRGYDSTYPFLETDGDGNNVLTNYFNISIPLYWPDWEDSRLEEIATLQTWTERSYEAIVRFLEGMKVDSLDDFIPSETDAIVEKAPSGRSRSGKRADRDRKGQCYHGEYESLRIIGPYLLFGVRRGEELVYLLDSPFYGIALRAFRNEADAQAYVAGGEERVRVAAKIVFKKITHDPAGNWEGLLERRLDEHCPLCQTQLT